MAFDEASLPFQQASYDKHLAEALALPEARVRRMLVKPDLPCRNALHVADLLAHAKDPHGRLSALPPDYPVRLSELAQAVVFACRLEQLHPAKRPPVVVEFARIDELRRLLATAYEAVALAGHVPTKPLEALSQGRSTGGMAQDCIDLVAVFREHAEQLSRRTPVTQAHLAEAVRIGQLALDTTLVGRRLRPRPEPKGASARHRLFTLLAETHEIARVMLALQGIEAPRLGALRLQPRARKRRRSPAPDVVTVTEPR